MMQANLSTSGVNPPLHHDQETLSADELQLRGQGHVGELPRQFSMFAALALAFSITNTWIGYSATFATPLLAGGGKAVFCCLILACVASTIMAAGLAELASAFPSSGGQYQCVLLL
jgi:choline transport protein